VNLGGARPAIPFNRACFVGTEQDYIAESVANGQISGNGPFGHRCEDWLEKHTGASRALLVTSCTHALEMAALLLDLQDGDEVIVPSFTFVSTASAFALRGARIVFADIQPDTLNIDPESVARLIGPRTRAVVIVHYGGVACDMEALTAVVAGRGVPIIEDNAHGLLGRYRGSPLGSFGAAATQSFHETKNFTCGEGGALLLNDPSWIERAEIIREKGTNRSQFFRGQVDKYTWVDLGSSYVLSDVLAAVLYSQLEAWEHIQFSRRTIWDRYDEELTAWATDVGVRRPIVPPDCDQSYHLYYLLLPSLDARTNFIRHLAERDILAVFHYQPLHLSTMGQRVAGPPASLPVTEDIADRLVRLPFYNDLSESDQQQVIEAVIEFRPG
jgi:dTDP-4-amino-4,6-dideoxygalactose transaminase